MSQLKAECVVDVPLDEYFVWERLFITLGLYNIKFGLLNLVFTCCSVSEVLEILKLDNTCWMTLRKGQYTVN
jgi:hypothetical protein